MISVNMLTNGEWYDGFLWKDGRQMSTDTLRWNGDAQVFTGYHHGEYPHVADHRKRQWSFEPNVVSTGEPAS